MRATVPRSRDERVVGRHAARVRVARKNVPKPSPPACVQRAMQAKTITALVLAGAGAVAASALGLEHNNAEGGATAERGPQPIACGTEAPSTASAKLEHGTLGATLAAAKVVRGAGGDVQAGFVLTTDRGDATQRPPLDLAFVIDPSGSMDDGRLDHAKSAARGILDRLGAQDHVALIQYDHAAQVVVASIATDREGKAK